MENIDLKDRKILYQLDLNCRQSNAQIGKKVGLGRKVVDYRIKRMEEEGIITGYWTAINTFKLGFEVYRVFIVFEYINEEKKNEIVQYFVKSKNTWVVVTLKGEIDLDVILWVKDSKEFHQYWNKTLDLYEDYFTKSTVSVYVEAINYKKSYLLTEFGEPNREHYRFSSTREVVDIDKLDFELLDNIVNDARIPIINLADKLECSSQTISYRLKNLMKKNIIISYRVHINYSKIGLRLFKVDIYFKEHKKKNDIINYLKMQHFLQCFNVAIGWADIEPEIVIKNIDELNSIMDKINRKYPGSIRKHVYWIIEKFHKERWLPEMEFNYIWKKCG